MQNSQHGNAHLAEWLERQKAIFEALSPKFEHMDAGAKGDEIWRSYMNFWTTLARTMPAQAGSVESALQSLVEPGTGMRAARSGPQDIIGRLAQGPSFATLWDWDQKSIKAYSAWLELQQAIMAHQAVVDRAWAEASQRFIDDISRPPDESRPPIASWRAGLDLWLATANRVLLETQRGEEFLATQRRVLRAAMDYRLRLGEIAEELCELFQVPGRSEIDELSRLVHDLRREVRALKREQRA
jgi:class III poly(R)-hydroxyalkanoic acid synthase PhaE subunit